MGREVGDRRKPNGCAARTLGPKPFLHLVCGGAANRWKGGTAPGRYVGVEWRAQEPRHALCHGFEIRTRAGAGNNVGPSRWKLSSQYHRGVFTGRPGDDMERWIGWSNSAFSPDVQANWT